MGICGKNGCNGFKNANESFMKLFKILMEHDRKCLSVQNKDNSRCVVTENNEANCLPTDRLFLEWYQKLQKFNNNKGFSK